MTKLLNHINTYQSEADYQNDNSKNFPNVSYIVENDNVLFKGIRYEQQYFAIESLEDNNAIMFKLSSNSGSPSASSAKTISVSTDDGGTWTDYTSTADGTTIATLNMGQKVLIKGNNNTYYERGGFRGGFSCFTASKQIDVNGNIMSLIYGDNFKEQYLFPSGTNYNFSNIFKSAPIVSAENLILPATTLTAYCYDSMFRGCTSLETAPVLPAETLADYCYQNMFKDCTNLVNAPTLPATTLAERCYQGMFESCTNLTTAPTLPATTLARGCYINMFKGCTGLTSAPELPATTLAGSCYSNMFNGTNVLPDCSNIDFTSNSVLSSGGLIGLFAGTKVTDSDLDRLLPKNANGKYYLPATTLANSCYASMFQNCTSLTTAPELPAMKLAKSCYNGMFADCTSLTTAPTLPAETLADLCYYYMFARCTSLVTAPALPSTTLASDCYGGMFDGCTNLNYIKCLATDISASNCTSNWVSGVASTGTFIKSANMTSWTTGVNGIPTGWTVQKVSS